MVMNSKKFKKALRGVDPRHFMLSGALIFGGYVACGDKSKAPEPPAEIAEPQPEAPAEEVVEQPSEKPSGEEPTGEVVPSRPIKERAEGYLGLAGLEMQELRNESGFIVYADKEEGATQFLAFADLNQLKMEVITPAEAGLAPLSSFASECSIAVNGGYFSTDRQESVSLLVDDGELLAEDAQGLGSKGNGFPSRGTLFLGEDGPAVTWATLGENGIETFAFPREADENKAAIEKGDVVTGKYNEALGAGPVLVMDSAIVSSSNAEWLSSSIKPNFPNSRSAMGLMKNNVVVIYVVTRKLPFNWGKTIKGMSQTLLGLGAISALNLDGGSSSGFVIDGNLVSRTSGEERPIASGLCVK